MRRTPEHIHDEWLVAPGRGGEPAALEELLRRWRGPLAAHAQRLTGSGARAGDVVQESMLAIARGIRRRDDPAAFRAWALRIVSRRSADWVRLRRRERSRSGAIAGEEAARDDGGAGEASDLRLALGRLDERDRALLTLRYGSELLVAEIGAALGDARGNREVPAARDAVPVLHAGRWADEGVVPAGDAASRRDAGAEADGAAGRAAGGRRTPPHKRGAIHRFQVGVCAENHLPR